MKKRKTKEESLQIAVSTYIKLQYPDVVFTAESSGIRLPIGLAVKTSKQRSKHKQPDMIILEPNMSYHGLVIELKKEGWRLKDGSIPNDEHTRKQRDTLDLLNKKGYYACFASGFDEAITIIDLYMKNMID